MENYHCHSILTEKAEFPSFFCLFFPFTQAYLVISFLALCKSLIKRKSVAQNVAPSTVSTQNNTTSSIQKR